MSNWTEIAELRDSPTGIPRDQNRYHDIAVFRNSQDEVFAMKDECPHKKGPLSQGIVHGTSVTCPLHNWKIDLQSGEALGPDEGCTNVFPGQGRRRQGLPGPVVNFLYKGILNIKHVIW